MGYDRPTGAGQFLSALAQGFVQTRLEIILFFVIIVAIVLAFAFVLLAQRRLARRRLAEHSRDMLEHLLVKLDLNEQETSLLGRLARYLGKDEPPYALLATHHIFDACALKMSRKEPGSEAHVKALRLKIGFRNSPLEEVPTSSLDLPSGSPVLLVTRAGAHTHGTVFSQSANAVSLQLDPGARPPTKGSPITLLFQNSAGVFSFSTTVKDSSGDAVYIEHSSSITRHQRRRYYRRREFLPVYISPASSSSPPIESRILDLGGGGARVQNPKGLLRKGDLLELSFSAKKGTITLGARVLRISKPRRSASLGFVSLTEAERSRIMRFLFAQSENREIPHS